MKAPRLQSKTLTLLATILMLLAIPISLVGLQTVNDIRNRASDLGLELEFSTDFSAKQLTTAYSEIPYVQTLELAGSFAPYATVSLGCDISACQESCPEIPSSLPEGLTVAPDGRTLYWENPVASAQTSSWNIVVSATAPSSEDPDGFICSVGSFSLSFSTEHENFAPTCTLFPPTQPDTIPAGFASALKLEASDDDGGIASATVNLSDENGIVESRTWTMDEAEKSIYLNKNSNPPLAFIAQDTGIYTYSAQVVDDEGTISDCTVSGTPEINIVIPGENGSPVFTTDPYSQSSPSTSLKIGQSYSYSIEATDPESDLMDYFVINNTGWLTFSVNNTEAGSFRGTFSGTPTAAGSYTAGIALNDNAHNHYSTQLWVINVDYVENDIPVVKITLPPTGYSVNNDEKMRIEWSSTDHNLITSYDVYLSTDPGNSSTFVPLVTGLGYNFNAFLWDVGSTTPGYYFIVVKATDNQTPPASGIGISPSFGISVSAEETPEVQPVITSHPTITNLHPSDKSEISDSTPFISADFTASDDMVIRENSFVIKIDNKEVTGTSTIEGEGAHSGSFMYEPTQPIGLGTHKVSVIFEDSSDQTASKSWTFTIHDRDDETEDAEGDTEDSDAIGILGLTIPRRIAIIVGVGVVLLIIALLIPWFFYAAWKSSKSEEDEPYSSYEPSSRNWRMSMGSSSESVSPERNTVATQSETSSVTLPSATGSPTTETSMITPKEQITETPSSDTRPPEHRASTSETILLGSVPEGKQEIKIKQVRELKPEALVEIPGREENESAARLVSPSTESMPRRTDDSSQQDISFSDSRLAGSANTQVEPSADDDEDSSLDELQNALQQLSENENSALTFPGTSPEKPKEPSLSPSPVSEDTAPRAYKPPIGPSDLSA